MEFGKLENIDDVNWDLPADDPKNLSWLKFNSGNSHIYLGSSGWSEKKWIGKIYPDHIKPDEYLYYYSRQFTCIELNTTHYRIPDSHTAQAWMEQVPSQFRFCPKFPNTISHSELGLSSKALRASWLQFLGSIQPNLGPSFIQFPERFSYQERKHLFHFVESWPSEFKIAIELRHESWFQDNKILPALGDYLNRKGIGLVITDVSGRRDVLHTSVTAPWVLIRLIGNDLDPSDERRLKDWSLRLSDWKNKGVDESYLFLHQPDDYWTIEFAEMAGRILKENGTLALPRIEKIIKRDLFNF